MTDVHGDPSPSSTLAPPRPTQPRRESLRPLRVVVALATYQRPMGLSRILPELVDQAESLASDTSFGFRCRTAVHVIDNDPAAGAQHHDRVRAGGRLRYFHEPEPGIAAARNRALDEAADADVLIFVDDDEVPAAGWLAALVSAWARWRCAAVTGPVRRRFEAGHVDPWVRHCGEFDRVQRPTGMVLAGGATNNLLLDVAQLRESGIRFDQAFGLSGGDDTMLTHAIVKHGGEIRWCDEAEVIDFIPASRSTRSWVLRRARRKGNTWSRVALALADTPRARRWQRVELTARGAHRLGRGVLTWTAGAVRGEVRARATGTMMIFTGIGLVSGVVGVVTSEYLRPAATTLPEPELTTVAS